MDAGIALKFIMQVCFENINKISQAQSSDSKGAVFKKTWSFYHKFSRFKIATPILTKLIYMVRQIISTNVFKRFYSIFKNKKNLFIREIISFFVMY